MPDWETINRKLREAEEEPEERHPHDVTPSEESWSGKGDRLQREADAEEKARRNEPGMLKIGFTLTFEKIANFFKPKKNEDTSPTTTDNSADD